MYAALQKCIKSGDHDTQVRASEFLSSNLLIDYKEDIAMFISGEIYGILLFYSFYFYSFFFHSFAFLFLQIHMCAGTYKQSIIQQRTLFSTHW